MALTITVVRRDRTRNGKFVIANIQFDSSYPTGGEALGVAEKTALGISKIDWFDAYQDASGSRRVVYDHTNDKILLYTAFNTEAADTSDQSTITIRALIKGDSPK